MDTRMDETLKPRGTELQLKGLIYVRALRAAGGASTEELQQFSAEIRRQRRQLEGERGQIGHGFVKAARPPPQVGSEAEHLFSCTLCLAAHDREDHGA